MDTVVFDRLQTMTTFHAMIVSARRKSLMDVARIPDRPTNDTHVWGGKRIGKQEGRNGKVSQDRCFFSKSRVRCPLNRNVGKVKLILSFSAYLSFLLFISLSLDFAAIPSRHPEVLYAWTLCQTVGKRYGPLPVIALLGCIHFCAPFVHRGCNAALFRKWKKRV